MLRIREIAVNRLRPWIDNPRRNGKAIPAVAKSIKAFGFNVPVLCDTQLRIVAGHTRVEAAKRLGMASVPAIVLPLSGRECRRFAIADNRTGELSDWDTPKLREILDELHSEDADLAALGFPSRELRRLLKVERMRDDSLPEPPKRTRTTPGTRWGLGPHRLLCGDSRHKATFTRLLGHTKVGHVFAGPPYFNQRAYSHWDDYATYLRHIDAVVARCYDVLEDGGILVWNAGNGSSTNHAHVIHHAALLEEHGFQFVDMIAWVKNAPNYTLFRHGHIRGSRCYYPAHQWEALHVYQKPGPMPRMTSEEAAYMWNHHTDVWQIPVVAHQARKHGHPAVCPVEIPLRTIQAYAGVSGTVLDPFGGSGTTLIAAERTGRRAFLVEKRPDYCDQIVKRWESVTGKRARRV
ncbi:MAG: DNA modification methylase [Candidatus Hydrogenedentes bacterium]|nr:DNA modification methylase [Candidatus Hydrogenedentota bacterium]